MKLKINRKALAILTAFPITLFSGCSNEENNESSTNLENTPVVTENINVTTSKVNNQTSKNLKEHQHLIVNFGNTPIIFKECEGYSIYIDKGYRSSEINYYIYKDTKYYYDSTHQLIDGQTPNYNYYLVTNEENVKQCEDAAIANGAYVYKIK